MEQRLEIQTDSVKIFVYLGKFLILLRVLRISSTSWPALNHPQSII